MMRKGWIIGIILLLKASPCGAVTPEALVKEGRYEEAISAYQLAIRDSRDDKERAKLHQRLGRVWAIREEFKKAAIEYLKALSLDRRGFSEDERFQMAIHLSWGSYLKEAIQMLSEIIQSHPEHLDARIHLARCFSWSGRYRDALREVDSILQKNPTHRDARFVQANVLRWKGELQKAISIYQELLKEKEDFDVRLGLTYALLARGDRKGAQESVSLLKPDYSYQQKELKKLQEEIQRRTSPFLGGQSQFYSDSDHNRLHRFALSGGGWIESWQVGLHFRETHAKDKVRDHQSEELSFRAHSRLFESLSVGGDLGVSQLRHRKTDHYLTGNLNVNVDLFQGTIGAGFARSVLVDTAQLIENRIRVTQAGFHITQNIGDGFSIYGSYFYRDYSDHNHAHDIQLIPRYTILFRDPRLTLGYRLRYLDFDKQTRKGYFDPDNFLSHQLLTSLEFEGERYSLFLEPYVGYQSFRRYGDRNHDFIVGGTGIFQYRIGKKVDLEIVSEAGNDALGTASGFKYYQFSLGLKVHF